jgi:hypothetical protein
VSLTGPRDVVELVALTISQVRRGQLDPRRANSVGFLAGIALRALEIGGGRGQAQAREQVEHLKVVLADPEAREALGRIEELMRKYSEAASQPERLPG